MGAAVAQSPELPKLPELPRPPQDTLFFLPNAAPLPAFGGRVDIIRSEGDVLGAVVTGKPYSARSITESTQTLADGNRIVQRNEALIHRDSEGRTRREQTLTGVGAWHADAPVTMINIHDPVAGKAYVLDPATRTAREARPLRMAFAPFAGELEGAQAELSAVFDAAVPAPVPTPGEPNVTVVRRAEGGGAENVRVFTAGSIAATGPLAVAAANRDVVTEDLGEQVLEGLLVRGTKVTDTIPAGALGNERPIEVVTERWYSEDIEAIVLHRHSDPRFGETIYRLVNVVRGDPSPDLFEVPQGYERSSAAEPHIGLRALPGLPGRRFELERVPAASSEERRD
jgi:hypothetical protein